MLEVKKLHDAIAKLTDQQQLKSVLKALGGFEDLKSINSPEGYKALSGALYKGETLLDVDVALENLINFQKIEDLRKAIKDAGLADYYKQMFGYEIDDKREKANDMLSTLLFPEGYEEPTSVTAAVALMKKVKELHGEIDKLSPQDKEHVLKALNNILKGLKIPFEFKNITDLSSPNGYTALASALFNKFGNIEVADALKNLKSYYMLEEMIKQLKDNDYTVSDLIQTEDGIYYNATKYGITMPIYPFNANDEYTFNMQNTELLFAARAGLNIAGYEVAHNTEGADHILYYEVSKTVNGIWQTVKIYPVSGKTILKTPQMIELFNNALLIRELRGLISENPVYLDYCSQVFGVDISKDNPATDEILIMLLWPSEDVKLTARQAFDFMRNVKDLHDYVARLTGEALSGALAVLKVNNLGELYSIKGYKALASALFNSKNERIAVEKAQANMLDAMYLIKLRKLIIEAGLAPFYYMVFGSNLTLYSIPDMPESDINILSTLMFDKGGHLLKNPEEAFALMKNIKTLYDKITAMSASDRNIIEKALNELLKSLHDKGMANDSSFSRLESPAGYTAMASYLFDSSLDGLKDIVLIDKILEYANGRLVKGDTDPQRGFYFTLAGRPKVKVYLYSPSGTRLINSAYGVSEAIKNAEDLVALKEWMIFNYTRLGYASEVLYALPGGRDLLEKTLEDKMEGDILYWLLPDGQAFYPFNEKGEVKKPTDPSILIGMLKIAAGLGKHVLEQKVIISKDEVDAKGLYWTFYYDEFGDYVATKAGPGLTGRKIYPVKLNGDVMSEHELGVAILSTGKIAKLKKDYESKHKVVLDDNFDKDRSSMYWLINGYPVYPADADGKVMILSELEKAAKNAGLEENLINEASKHYNVKPVEKAGDSAINISYRSDEAKANDNYYDADVPLYVVDEKGEPKINDLDGVNRAMELEKYRQEAVKAGFNIVVKQTSKGIKWEVAHPNYYKNEEGEQIKPVTIWPVDSDGKVGSVDKLKLTFAAAQLKEVAIFNGYEIIEKIEKDENKGNITYWEVTHEKLFKDNKGNTVKAKVYPYKKDNDGNVSIITSKELSDAMKLARFIKNAELNGFKVSILHEGDAGYEENNLKLRVAHKTIEGVETIVYPFTKGLLITEQKMLDALHLQKLYDDGAQAGMLIERKTETNAAGDIIEYWSVDVSNDNIVIRGKKVNKVKVYPFSAKGKLIADVNALKTTVETIPYIQDLKANNNLLKNLPDLFDENDYLYWNVLNTDGIVDKIYPVKIVNGRVVVMTDADFKNALLMAVNMRKLKARMGITAQDQYDSNNSNNLYWEINGVKIYPFNADGTLKSDREIELLIINANKINVARQNGERGVYITADKARLNGADAAKNKIISDLSEGKINPEESPLGTVDFEESPIKKSWWEKFTEWVSGWFGKEALSQQASGSVSAKKMSEESVQKALSVLKVVDYYDSKGKKLPQAKKNFAVRSQEVTVAGVRQIMEGPNAGELVVVYQKEYFKRENGRMVSLGTEHLVEFKGELYEQYFDAETKQMIDSSTNASLNFNLSDKAAEREIRGALQLNRHEKLGAVLAVLDSKSAEESRHVYESGDAAVFGAQPSYEMNLNNGYLAVFSNVYDAAGNKKGIKVTLYGKEYGFTQKRDIIDSSEIAIRGGYGVLTSSMLHIDELLNDAGDVFFARAYPATSIDNNPKFASGTVRRWNVKTTEHLDISDENKPVHLNQIFGDYYEIQNGQRRHIMKLVDEKTAERFLISPQRAFWGGKTLILNEKGENVYINSASEKGVSIINQSGINVINGRYFDDDAVKLEENKAKGQNNEGHNDAVIIRDVMNDAGYVFDGKAAGFANAEGAPVYETSSVTNKYESFDNAAGYEEMFADLENAGLDKNTLEIINTLKQQNPDLNYKLEDLTWAKNEEFDKAGNLISVEWTAYSTESAYPLISYKSGYVTFIDYNIEENKGEFSAAINNMEMFDMNKPYSMHYSWWKKAINSVSKFFFRQEAFQPEIVYYNTDAVFKPETIFDRQDWEFMVDALKSSGENFAGSMDAVSWMNANFSELKDNSIDNLNNITPQDAQTLMSMLLQNAFDKDGNPLVKMPDGAIIAVGAKEHPSKPDGAIYILTPTTWTNAKDAQSSVRDMSVISQLWDSLSAEDIKNINELYSYYDYTKNNGDGTSGGEVAMNLPLVEQKDENGNITYVKPSGNVLTPEVRLQLYQFIYSQKMSFAGDKSVVSAGEEYKNLSPEEIAANIIKSINAKVRFIKAARHIDVIDKKITLFGKEFTLIRVSALYALKHSSSEITIPETGFISRQDHKKLDNLLYASDGKFSYAAGDNLVFDARFIGAEKFIIELLHKNFFASFVAYLLPLSVTYWALKKLGNLGNKDKRKKEDKKRRKNINAMTGEELFDALKKFSAKYNEAKRKAGETADIISEKDDDIMKLSSEIISIRNMAGDIKVFFALNGQADEQEKIQQYFNLVANNDEKAAKFLTAAANLNIFGVGEITPQISDRLVEAPSGIYDWIRLNALSNPDDQINWTESAYPDMIVIKRASEVLGLTYEKLYDLLKDIKTHSSDRDFKNDTYLLSTLKTALVNAAEGAVYDKLAELSKSSISNEEKQAELSAIFARALPTDSVLALRNMVSQKIITASDVAKLIGNIDGKKPSKDKFSDLYLEIIKKIINDEYENNIKPFLPAGLENPLEYSTGNNLREKILERIALDTRASLALNPFAVSKSGERIDIKQQAGPLAATAQNLKERIISELLQVTQSSSDKSSLGLNAIYWTMTMYLTRKIIQVAEKGSGTEIQKRKQITKMIKDTESLADLQSWFILEMQGNVTNVAPEKRTSGDLSSRFMDEDLRYLFALLTADFESKNIEEFKKSTTVKHASSINLYNMTGSDLKEHFSNVAEFLIGANVLTVQRNGKSAQIKKIEDIENEDSIELISAIIECHSNIKLKLDKSKLKNSSYLSENEMEVKNLSDLGRALKNDYLSLAKHFKVSAIAQMDEKAKLGEGGKNQIVSSLKKVHKDFLSKFIWFGKKSLKFWGITTKGQKAGMFATSAILAGLGIALLWVTLPISASATGILYFGYLLGPTIAMSFMGAALLLPKMMFGKSESASMKKSYVKLASFFSMYWGGILGGFFFRGLPIALFNLGVFGGGAFAILPLFTIIISLAIWAFIGPSTFFAMFNFMTSVRGQKAKSAQMQTEEYKKRTLKIKIQTYGILSVIIGALSLLPEAGALLGVTAAAFAPWVLIIGGAAAIIVSYAFKVRKSSRFKSMYESILAKEKYGMIVQGSTVQSYLERTVNELFDKGYISAAEKNNWIEALDGKSEFIPFKDPKALEFIESAFESLSLYKPELGSKNAIPSSSIVVQSYQEVAELTMDRLLLPETFDKKGNLLGKYASSQSQRWSEVIAKIEAISLDGINSSDKDELKKFIVRLKNLNETHTIDLPKLESDGAKAALKEIARHVEDFGQRTVWSQSVVFQDIASDIYQMHRKLSLDNSDLAYSGVLPKIFSQYGGSLQEAYRQITAKAERTDDENAFLQYYPSYKSKVDALLSTTFQDDAMHGDVILTGNRMGERQVEKINSLSNFIKDLEKAAKDYPANAALFKGLAANLKAAFYSGDALKPMTLGKVGRSFEEFRKDNLYEINEAIKIMQAGKNTEDAGKAVANWTNFSRHGAILYYSDFYDVGLGLHPMSDRTVPGAKTAGQGMNMERMGKVNDMRDAHVGVMIGQSEFFPYLLARTGRDFESGAMAVNSPMTIAADEVEYKGKGIFKNRAKPIVYNAYTYGRAQLNWTTVVQQGVDPYTSFYGKGTLSKYALSTLLTPGEDSAALYSLAAYHTLGFNPSGVAPHSKYSPIRKLIWGRPNTKIIYTEKRYAMNVTRFDVEVLDLLDDSDTIGWDRKLTVHTLNMHYQNSYSALMFMSVFRLLVLFSSFAYLMPFWLAILFSTVLSQGSSVGMFVNNIFNYGDVFRGFRHSLRDLYRGFPFWTYLQPLMAEGVKMAANALYKFGGTYKDRKLREGTVKERYDAVAVKWGFISTVFGGLSFWLILLFNLFLPGVGVVPSILMAFLADFIFSLASTAYIDGKNAYGANIQKDGSVKSEKLGYFYSRALWMTLGKAIFVFFYAIDFFRGMWSSDITSKKSAINKLFLKRYNRVANTVDYTAFTTVEAVADFEKLQPALKDVIEDAMIKELSSVDTSDLRSRMRKAGFSSKGELAFPNIANMNGDDAKKAELKKYFRETADSQDNDKKEAVRYFFIAVLNKVIDDFKIESVSTEFLQLLKENDLQKLKDWVLDNPDNAFETMITYYVEKKIDSLQSESATDIKDIAQGFFDFGIDIKDNKLKSRVLMGSVIRAAFEIDIRHSFSYNVLKGFNDNDNKDGVSALSVGNKVRNKNLFIATAILMLTAGVFLSSGNLVWAIIFLGLTIPGIFKKNDNQINRNSHLNSKALVIFSTIISSIFYFLLGIAWTSGILLFIVAAFSSYQIYKNFKSNNNLKPGDSLIKKKISRAPKVMYSFFPLALIPFGINIPVVLLFLISGIYILWALGWIFPHHDGFLTIKQERKKAEEEKESLLALKERYDKSVFEKLFSTIDKYDLGTVRKIHSDNYYQGLFKKTASFVNDYEQTKSEITIFFGYASLIQIIRKRGAIREVKITRDGTVSVDGKEVNIFNKDNLDRLIELDPKIVIVLRQMFAYAAGIGRKFPGDPYTIPFWEQDEIRKAHEERNKKLGYDDSVHNDDTQIWSLDSGLDAIASKLKGLFNGSQAEKAVNVEEEAKKKLLLGDNNFKVTPAALKMSIEDINAVITKLSEQGLNPKEAGFVGIPDKVLLSINNNPDWLERTIELLSGMGVKPTMANIVKPPLSALAVRKVYDALRPGAVLQKWIESNISQDRRRISIDGSVQFFVEGYDVSSQTREDISSMFREGIRAAVIRRVSARPSKHISLKPRTIVPVVYGGKTYNIKVEHFVSSTASGISFENKFENDPVIKTLVVENEELNAEIADKNIRAQIYNRAYNLSTRYFAADLKNDARRLQHVLGVSGVGMIVYNERQILEDLNEFDKKEEKKGIRFRGALELKENRREYFNKDGVIVGNLGLLMAAMSASQEEGKYVQMPGYDNALTLDADKSRFLLDESMALRQMNNEKAKNVSIIRASSADIKEIIEALWQEKANAVTAKGAKVNKIRNLLKSGKDIKKIVDIKASDLDSDTMRKAYEIGFNGIHASQVKEDNIVETAQKMNEAAGKYAFDALNFISVSAQAAKSNAHALKAAKVTPVIRIENATASNIENALRDLDGVAVEFNSMETGDELLGVQGKITAAFMSNTGGISKDKSRVSKINSPAKRYASTYKKALSSDFILELDASKIKDLKEFMMFDERPADFEAMKAALIKAGVKKDSVAYQYVELQSAANQAESYAAAKAYLRAAVENYLERAYLQAVDNNKKSLYDKNVIINDRDAIRSLLLNMAVNGKELTKESIKEILVLQNAALSQENSTLMALKAQYAPLVNEIMSDPFALSSQDKTSNAEKAFAIISSDASFSAYAFDRAVEDMKTGSSTASKAVISILSAA
ncbi:MAG: MFS transporter [Endomicrobium sp.]|nr:MFS transporter [Endomicrobium sp.]